MTADMSDYATLQKRYTASICKINDSFIKTNSKKKTDETKERWGQMCNTD